jgi:hypothetical protein
MNILKTFGVQFLLIAVCAPLLQIICPWWIIAPVAFLVCFFKKTSAFGSFLSSFLAVFLAWLIIALRIHLITDGILSVKMAYLFPFGGSVTALLLVSSLVGAIVSGFAGLTGNLAASLLFDKKIKNTDYRLR